MLAHLPYENAAPLTYLQSRLIVRYSMYDAPLRIAQAIDSLHDALIRLSTRLAEVRDKMQFNLFLKSLEL